MCYVLSECLLYPSPSCLLNCAIIITINLKLHFTSFMYMYENTWDIWDKVFPLFWVSIISIYDLDCAVPENIHTHHMEGHWKF